MVGLLNSVCGGSRPAHLATILPIDLTSGDLSACRIRVNLRVVVFFEVSVAICECLIDSLIHVLLLYTLLDMLVAAGTSNCMRLASLGRVYCVFGRCEHELGQLNEARTVCLLKFEHKSYDF